MCRGTAQYDFVVPHGRKLFWAISMRKIVTKVTKVLLESPMNALSIDIKVTDVPPLCGELSAILLTDGQIVVPHFADAWVNTVGYHP